ncbi:MAG: gluconokinase [Bryobacteraceae bacterium]
MPQDVRLIVSLDVGTSSVRTLVFDHRGRQQEGFGQQIPYRIETTPDGGVEADPDLILKLCVQCLAKTHSQLKSKPAGIAFDTFWHSFLGVDRHGKPTTPIVHLFDTRSTGEAAELARKLDPKQVHARTGCNLHPSYWPAKLVWLSRHRKHMFKATDRWMSFGEYLFLKLFGSATASTSMVSASGLWNQVRNHYDEDVLAALPIEGRQLAPVAGMDDPQSELIGAYKKQWPLFEGIPWYPALGDGACNNIGSGCTSHDLFALMVGTSGAMRAVIKSDKVKIPPGLFCYRVDRKRFVLGGALSNGGDVYAWLRRTLLLPDPTELERTLSKSKPGSHGMIVLPFFAGERSPYWRPDLRGAITGLNLSTTAVEILQVALESVSLRFREIFGLMVSSLGQPKHVISSGGALRASPAWTQMMADAIGVQVQPCLEPEATSRGAVLLASERLGLIGDVSLMPFKKGTIRKARAHNTRIYEEMLAGQRDLYDRLFN